MEVSRIDELIGKINRTARELAYLAPREEIEIYASELIIRAIEANHLVSPSIVRPQKTMFGYPVKQYPCNDKIIVAWKYHSMNYQKGLMIEIDVTPYLDFN